VKWKEPDEQLNLLAEAVHFAEEATAGAAAEVRGGSATIPGGRQMNDANNADARLRLLAAKQTVEEIEARIALRRMKLSGRKVH
jgi:hypothetical protein